MSLPEVQICQILKFYLEDYPYLSLEDHNFQDHPHKAAKVYQKNSKIKWRDKLCTSWNNALEEPREPSRKALTPPRWIH
jgi:hypothetical protein